MELDMLSPTCLLLVEPDLSTQAEVRTILEGEGYHVTLAANVATAQRYISRQAFELIITELYFRRRQDRFRVVELLRAQADPTPVGILTKAPATASEIQARGFAWYLPKPVEHNALLAQVAASLPFDCSSAQYQQQATCWAGCREQARLAPVMSQERAAWNTEVELLDGDTTWGSEARSTVRCELCHSSLDAAEAYFSRYTGEAICQKCHYIEEEEEESDGVDREQLALPGAGTQNSFDIYPAPSNPLLHFTGYRSTQACD